MKTVHCGSVWPPPVHVFKTPNGLFLKVKLDKLQAKTYFFFLTFWPRILRESNPNPIKDGKSRSINHDLMNHNSFYGTYISATRAAIHLGILLVHGHPFGECTGASLRKRKIGQNPKMCNPSSILPHPLSDFPSGFNTFLPKNQV